MAKDINGAIGNLAAIAKNSVEKIDVEAAKKKMVQASKEISEKAAVIKDSAVNVKEDIDSKIHELDRLLETSITEYNDAYTLMNDKGIKLYVERCRTIDAIATVENIVNSIANHPKSFNTDFEEINVCRNQFVDSCTFAEQELYAARAAASGAGAGLAAGASVAFMAPTAAMWIATTFGTASTGTAIATLSGAAATNAALAWLGGGALAAGGGGVSAGSALLALAGPIGWSIAGATLLSSIILFASKRAKMNKQKNEEISGVKNNTEAVRELDAKIAVLLDETDTVLTNLNSLAMECMSLYQQDYSAFSDEEKKRAGALVNNTKTLSVLLGKTIG